MTDPIAFGTAYDVTTVNDETPVALADFVGEAQLMLDQQGELLHVGGSGTMSTESVRFHEADSENGDEDLRVWQIRQNGETFTAEHVSD